MSHVRTSKSKRSKPNNIFQSPLMSRQTASEYWDRAIFNNFSPVRPTFPIVADLTGYPESGGETARAILEDYHEEDSGLSTYLLAGGSNMNVCNPFSMLSCVVTCTKYSCFSMTDNCCRVGMETCSVESSDPDEGCCPSAEEVSCVPKFCCQAVCFVPEVMAQALNASLGSCVSYTCCIPTSSLCGVPLEDKKPHDSPGVKLAKDAANSAALCKTSKPVCCTTTQFDTQKRRNPYRIFIHPPAPPVQQTMDAVPKPKLFS